MEVTKPEKIVANFRSQFSYQNAILLIKFHVGGWVGGGGGEGSFSQEFKISFEQHFTTFSQKKYQKVFYWQIAETKIIVF